MKLLIVSIFIILYANCVIGLSPDLQKKLVDEINKDRMVLKEKIELCSNGTAKCFLKEEDMTMQEITYDASLEKYFDDPHSCEGDHPNRTQRPYIAALKANEVYENGFNNDIHYEREWLFMNPNQKTIACSATYRCTKRMQQVDYTDSKFITSEGEGKVYGACTFGLRSDRHKPLFINLNFLKSPEKYGDIIGVTMTDIVPTEAPSGQSDGAKESSSSERVFSLILSLFLMFCI